MDCGAHSECINSPEENQGYRCDQINKALSLATLCGNMQIYNNTVIRTSPE